MGIKQRLGLHYHWAALSLDLKQRLNLHYHWAALSMIGLILTTLHNIGRLGVLAKTRSIHTSVYHLAGVIFYCSVLLQGHWKQIVSHPGCELYHWSERLFIGIFMVGSDGFTPWVWFFFSAMKGSGLKVAFSYLGLTFSHPRCELFATVNGYGLEVCNFVFGSNGFTTWMALDWMFAFLWLGLIISHQRCECL